MRWWNWWNTPEAWSLIERKRSSSNRKSVQLLKKLHQKEPLITLQELLFKAIVIRE